MTDPKLTEAMDLERRLAAILQDALASGLRPNIDYDTLREVHSFIAAALAEKDAVIGGLVRALERIHSTTNVPKDFVHLAKEISHAALAQAKGASHAD